MNVHGDDTLTYDSSVSDYIGYIPMFPQEYFWSSKWNSWTMDYYEREIFGSE
jgi:hypothetical protein